MLHSMLLKTLHLIKYSMSSGYKNSNCPGRNVVPNRHLCKVSKHVFLADNKTVNVSLDVQTFIAQNLPKYRLQSSLDYTFLSLS